MLEHGWRPADEKLGEVTDGTFPYAAARALFESMKLAVSACHC